jgi:hypothetical protein
MNLLREAHAGSKGGCGIGFSFFALVAFSERLNNELRDYHNLVPIKKVRLDYYLRSTPMNVFIDVCDHKLPRFHFSVFAGERTSSKIR